MSTAQEAGADTGTPGRFRWGRAKPKRSFSRDAVPSVASLTSLLESPPDGSAPADTATVDPAGAPTAVKTAAKATPKADKWAAKHTRRKTGGDSPEVHTGRKAEDTGAGQAFQSALVEERGVGMMDQLERLRGTLHTVLEDNCPETPATRRHGLPKKTGSLPNLMAAAHMASPYCLPPPHASPFAAALSPFAAAPSPFPSPGAWNPMMSPAPGGYPPQDNPYAAMMGMPSPQHLMYYPPPGMPPMQYEHAPQQGPYLPYSASLPAAGPYGGVAAPHPGFAMPQTRRASAAEGLDLERAFDEAVLQMQRAPSAQSHADAIADIQEQLRSIRVFLGAMVQQQQLRHSCLPPSAPASAPPAPAAHHSSALEDFEEGDSASYIWHDLPQQEPFNPLEEEGKKGAQGGSSWGYPLTALSPTAAKALAAHPFKAQRRLSFGDSKPGAGAKSKPLVGEPDRIKAHSPPLAGGSVAAAGAALQAAAEGRSLKAGIGRVLKDDTPKGLAKGLATSVKNQSGATKAANTRAVHTVAVSVRAGPA